MSVRYHISPTTGRPNICRAEKECPIGGAHYDNKVDARAGYEASQAAATIPTAQKKVKKAAVVPEVSIGEEALAEYTNRIVAEWTAGEHPDNIPEVEAAAREFAYETYKGKQLEENADAEAWANQILREVAEIESPATVEDDYDPWADDEDEEVRPKAYSWD